MTTSRRLTTALGRVLPLCVVLGLGVMRSVDAQEQPWRPTESRASSPMEAIEETSRTFQVCLRSFRTLSCAPGDNHRYRLTVEGSLSQLVMYLAALHRVWPGLVVEELAIDPLDPEVEASAHNLRTARVVVVAPSSPAADLRIPAPPWYAVPSDPLVESLATAHRKHDNAAITAAENALFEKYGGGEDAAGSPDVDSLREACRGERSFLVSVSLAYVVRRLEQRAGLADLLTDLRSSEDLEKIRLGFMLLRLPKAEVPAMKRALATERDPSVRKYLKQALAQLDSDADPEGHELQR